MKIDIDPIKEIVTKSITRNMTLENNAIIKGPKIPLPSVFVTIMIIWSDVLSMVY